MLLGARSSLLSVQKGHTAADYVQDGLVALWDGIENAGWRKHEDNPSIWKDLTGHGYDFTLKSGWYVWGDDFIARKSGVGGAAGSVQVPVSEWMFFDGCLQSSSGHAVDLGYPTANREIFPKDNSARVMLSGNSKWIYKTARPFFNTISVEYDSDGYAISAYLDGISATLGTGGSSYSAMYGSVQGVIRLGHGNNAWGYTGKYHSLRLYSRALTADEVAANCAIDMERFELS